VFSPRDSDLLCGDLGGENRFRDPADACLAEHLREFGRNCGYDESLTRREARVKPKSKILAAAAAEIRAFCAANANAAQAARYARFFTEGYDPYGITKGIWEANRLRFYEQYRDRLGLPDFLDLGDILLESGKYEEASFAVATLMQLRDQLTPEAFQRIGGWLEHGVRNWAHSDIICGELLGPCLKTRVTGLSDMSSWRDSGTKWKRRAVPVAMLALLDGSVKAETLLKFVRPLMADQERVVHQGVGWFLREAWKRNPAQVEVFLMEWKDTAPRLIFQYATEKMSATKKAAFRRSPVGNKRAARSRR
jgi:3-methyladenine DNA glycosylase AlkD